MIEFKVAAEAEVAEDEDYVEVPIEDKVYHARLPSTGQFALFAAAQADKSGPKQVKSIFDMVEAMLGEEALEHIKDLVQRRAIDIDDLFGGGTDLNPNAGLIDSILEELGGRPTQPSTDSSPSRGTGGRRSTGRTPGKGSTRSSSPSAGS